MDNIFDYAIKDSSSKEFFSENSIIHISEKLLRCENIGLPQLSEIEVMRHYKELSDLISKQEIFSKEITINSLKELKNLLFQLDKEITNLVDTNYNIFKRKVESYNRKTYYFLIFSKMAILSLFIFSK